MQSNLIRYLLEQENFETYGRFLRKEHFADNVTSWEIFKQVKQYFKDNEEDLTVDELQQYHLGIAGDKYSDDRREEIITHYEEIEEAEITEPAAHFFRQLELQDNIFSICQELSEMAHSPDGDRISELGEQLVHVSTKHADVENMFDTPSLEDLRELLENSKRWEWFDEDINTELCGFGDERVVGIFAPTNCGKTSLVCTAVEHFMEQGARVLDVSISEDTLVGRFNRYLQAYHHVTDEKLDKGLERYYNAFMKDYSDQFFYKNVSRCSMAEIRKWIIACEPDILVVDNFTKVQFGNKDEKGHKKVGSIATEIKALAKEYHFGAIIVCQASASAEPTKPNGDKIHKKKLTADDMQDSKIDVPGELQGAIAIARGKYSNQNDIRYISFPKSKLNGAAEEVVLTRKLRADICKWEV